MNHIDSEKDPGGETNPVGDSAGPHDDEDIVRDLHEYHFPGKDRDKESGR